MSDSITTNLQLARHLMSAVDRGDEGALPDLVHPSHRDHGGRLENTGVDGVVDTLRWLHETYDDMSNTLEDLIATDDRVVARVRFRGTPKAALNGVEPNGGPIDVEHIHIWRVADGKLAEHWMVRDDLAAIHQMAAAPTA
jgi:predicted ester cyclase